MTAWTIRMKQRLRVLLALQRRDVRATLYAQGLYAIMFLSLVAASLVLRNEISVLRTNKLLVTSNPLLEPMAIYAQLIASYLAISSAIAIARDRDRGTLELLLYGPVDYGSYLLGKFTSQMLCYGVSMVFCTLAFLVVSQLTSLLFSISLLWLVVLSFFASSCVASMGLLLSTLSGNVRRSLLLVISILALFIVLEIGYTALASMDIQDPESPILYFREAIGFIYRFAGIISPFAPLQRGVVAVLVGSAKLYLAQLGISILYTAIMLGLAGFVLSRKGVR